MSKSENDPQDSSPRTRPPDVRAGRRPVSIEDVMAQAQARMERGGPPTARPAGGSPSRFPGGCLSLVVLAVVLFLLGPVLLEMSVDWQWFGSLGLQGVFGTRLQAGLLVFLVGFVVALVFLLVNWSIARRIVRPGQLFPGQQPSVPPWLLGLGSLGGSIIAALLFGLIAGGGWSRVLAFFNHTAFGTTDPLFNLDIGFYVFELPLYEFLRGWALSLLVVTAIGAAILYSTRPGLLAGGGRFDPDHRLVAHFTLLGVAFLLLMALGYWFDSYDLLFSDHASFYGASYTDVHARLVAFQILMVITALIAVLLLVNLRLRALVPLGIAAGVWILAQVLIGGLYPGFVQNFTVKPAESDKERPYIQNNITATRAAFSLENFNERRADAATALTRSDIASNQPLVNSIRLWDYRPLLTTYGQLQSLRPYYIFRGVDLDRYPLAGGEEQIMIAARELNPEGLSEQARTWQNQHLVFTHGYGVVASPVNEIENAGAPHFLVRDLPPVSEDPVLQVTRPQIYYGEAEDNYVVVRTGTQEFDYPAGDKDVTTTYDGSGGVVIGNFLNRVQLASYFGDFTLLISDLIHEDSRVLFHRDIHDAVVRVAPFLHYDADPYIVVADGKLYWIQDAYTTTDRYPNSTPHAIEDDSANYIRNSVKVVIDAYTGSMDFYVVDSKDPLIATYRRIFPTLFKDESAMPAALRAHVRYPEGLFNIQAETYDTFHMTDPQVFYNRGDVWKVPFGNRTESAAPLEAYYTMMRLPGETKNEFMLMVPFTPVNKQNMIAWMAARGDAPDYGRVDVIRFPSNTIVFGPQQVDAQVNQDPAISSQLTLWSQSGSQVLRGNLLVLPIANSVLYVQPLFLQATSSGSIPELKRVIAATGGQVGIGEDLPAALEAMFGSRAQPPPTTGPGTPTPVAGSPVPLNTPGGPTPALSCQGDARSLSADALLHYQRAQDALKTSDWPTYGREQALVEADLRCLQQVTR